MGAPPSHPRFDALLYRLRAVDDNIRRYEENYIATRPVALRVDGSVDMSKPIYAVFDAETLAAPPPRTEGHDVRDQIVSELRAHGVSWASIAYQLQLSPEAAEHLYTKEA